MRKWLGVGFLGCVWLVDCGGKSLTDGQAAGLAGAFSAGASAAGAPDPGPAAGALAGAGTGGSEPSGGQGATSGQAGAPPLCPPDSRYVFCATWCGSPGADYVEGECQGGSWRCPGPLVDPNDCPSESCVLQRVECCDHKFGKRSMPDCGPDGLFAPCPVELERNAKLCVADSAHTTDCSTLDGQSCSLEEAQCETPPAHCQCVAKDGGLLWNCAYDLL